MARGQIYKNDPSKIEDGFYAEDLGDNWRLVETQSPVKEDGNINLLETEVMEDLKLRGYYAPKRAQRYLRLMPLMSATDERNYYFVNQQNVIKIHGDVVEYTNEGWKVVKPGIYRLNDPFIYLKTFPKDSFTQEFLNMVEGESSQWVYGEENNKTIWGKNFVDPKLALGVKVSMPTFKETGKYLVRFLPLNQTLEDSSKVGVYRDGTIAIEGRAVRLVWADFLDGIDEMLGLYTTRYRDDDINFLLNWTNNHERRFVYFADMDRRGSLEDSFVKITDEENTLKSVGYEFSTKTHLLRLKFANAVKYAENVTSKLTYPVNFGPIQITNKEDPFALLYTEVSIVEQGNSLADPIVLYESRLHDNYVDRILPPADVYLDELGLVPIGLKDDLIGTWPIYGDKNERVTVNFKRRETMGQVKMSTLDHHIEVIGPVLFGQNGSLVKPGVYDWRWFTNRFHWYSEDLGDYLETSDYFVLRPEDKYYPSDFSITGVSMWAKEIPIEKIPYQFRYIARPEWTKTEYEFLANGEQQEYLILNPMLIDNGVYTRLSRYYNSSFETTRYNPPDYLAIRGTKSNYNYDITKDETANSFPEIYGGLFKPHCYGIMPFKNQENIEVTCHFDVLPFRWKSNLNTIVPPITICTAPINTLHDIKVFQQMQDYGLLDYIRDWKDQWYLDITDCWINWGLWNTNSRLHLNPLAAGKRFLSIAVEKAWIKLLKTIPVRIASFEELDVGRKVNQPIDRVGCFQRTNLSEVPVTLENRCYLSEYFAVSDNIDAYVIGRVMSGDVPLRFNREPSILVASTPQVADSKIAQGENKFTSSGFNGKGIGDIAAVLLEEDWMDRTLKINGRIVSKPEKKIIARNIQRYTFYDDEGPLQQDWRYHSGLIIGDVFMNAEAVLPISPGFRCVRLADRPETVTLFEGLAVEDNKGEYIFRYLTQDTSWLYDNITKDETFPAVYFRQFYHNAVRNLKKGEEGYYGLDTRFFTNGGNHTDEELSSSWMVNKNYTLTWNYNVVSTNNETGNYQGMVEYLNRAKTQGDYHDSQNVPWVHVLLVFPMWDFQFQTFQELMREDNKHETSIFWNGNLDEAKIIPSRLVGYYDNSDGYVATDLHGRVHSSNQKDIPMGTGVKDTGSGAGKRRSINCWFDKYGYIIKPNVPLSKYLTSEWKEVVYPPICLWTGDEELNTFAERWGSSISNFDQYGVGATPNMLVQVPRSSALKWSYVKLDGYGGTVEQLVRNQTSVPTILPTSNPFGVDTSPINTARAKELWETYRDQAGVLTPTLFDQKVSGWSRAKWASLMTTKQATNVSVDVSVKTYFPDYITDILMDTTGFVNFANLSVKFNFIDNEAARRIYMGTEGWANGSAIGLDMGWHWDVNKEQITFAAASALLGQFNMFESTNLTLNRFKNNLTIRRETSYFDIKTNLIALSKSMAGKY